MGIPVHVYGTDPSIAEPELARRVRETSATNDARMRLVEETEIAALYDTIVRGLQRSPTDGVRVVRSHHVLYEKYEKLRSSGLQGLLNARLETEHGIRLRNLRVEGQRRCVHGVCDCGCSDACFPCCAWNLAFACVPLVYWIPRFCGCMVLDEWLVTAEVIV